jgi:hypothetical protein
LFGVNCIVIADDDVYYKRTWLKELVSDHTPGNREVVCSRANFVEIQDDGHFKYATRPNNPAINWRVARALKR